MRPSKREEDNLPVFLQEDLDRDWTSPFWAFYTFYTTEGRVEVPDQMVMP